RTTTCDLGDSVGPALDKYTPSGGHVWLTAEAEPNTSLALTDHPVHVEGAPTRFKQIFGNLLNQYKRHTGIGWQSPKHLSDGSSCPDEAPMPTIGQEDSGSEPCNFSSERSTDAEEI